MLIIYNSEIPSKLMAIFVFVYSCDLNAWTLIIPQVISHILSMFEYMSITMKTIIVNQSIVYLKPYYI